MFWINHEKTTLEKACGVVLHKVHKTAGKNHTWTRPIVRQILYDARGRPGAAAALKRLPTWAGPCTDSCAVFSFAVCFLRCFCCFFVRFSSAFFCFQFFTVLPGSLLFCSFFIFLFCFFFYVIFYFSVSIFFSLFAYI